MKQATASWYDDTWFDNARLQELLDLLPPGGSLKRTQYHASGAGWQVEIGNKMTSGSTPLGVLRLGLGMALKDV